MIRAIIFDFDGVIVESVDIKTDAFARLFESEGKEVVKKVVEYHLANTGVSRFEKFKHIYKEILKKELKEEIFKDLCQQFSKLVVDEVVKAPFVLGAIEFLKNYAQEYKFFVVSATPEDELENILGRREIKHYFAGVYGAPQKKSAVIKKIIDTNNLRPQEVIYIGDALSDYKAAKINSVYFVARVQSDNNLFEGIDCLKIKDLMELEILLRAGPLVEKEELVLAFSAKDCIDIRQKPGDSIKEIPWLYLGQDFFNRRYIEQRLRDQFRRIDIARFLDEVANDIRIEHVNWIDNLNRGYGKNLWWWFGPISSRDVYNSDLFQYCCYLEILERLWKDYAQRPRLVVIESWGLAKAIMKWASKKNISVRVVHPYYGRLKFMFRYLIPFLQCLEFLITLLLRLAAAWFSRIKYKPKDLKFNSAIIIDTFVHDNCLLEDGTFKDRYYPYLYEYLREKGKTVVVHPVLFGFRYNYFSIYQRMRKSNTNFIVPEDFLDFRDYLYALSYPVRYLFQKIKPIPFRGFDLSDILSEEKRTRLAIPNLQATLIYRLFFRLKKTGLQPQIIIDWYENQVIDKALIAGVRQAFPKAKVIGVQMFMHSLNWLSLFPSQSEVEAELTPHFLLETSNHQCLIVQSFTNAVPCKPAAALRCAYLFNDKKPNLTFGEKKQAILVLLSFNIFEAVELLEMLKEVLGQVRKGVRILIRGHPDYSPEDLVRLFGKEVWPTSFEIATDNLLEVLDQASLVISSSSSSMVEAVAKGIPVIFLGRQTVLNHNILANLNTELVTDCFSSSELILAINKYLNLSSNKILEYRKRGKDICDLFFTPVNAETLLPFLGINGN